MLHRIRAPLINGNSWLRIAFTLFEVMVGSLSLVVDFDLIEQAVERRARST